MENASDINNVEKQKKPPYGAVIWYKDFFSLLERTQPDKVDSKFLKNNNITSGSNVYSVISGLKFLGLLDENGKSLPKLLSLRVMGDEYQKNLQKILNEAYSELIQKVDLSKAFPDDITNYFITRYDMPRSTALQAGKVFVFLAQKAGIALSQELIGFLTLDQGVKKNTSKSITKSELKKNKPESEKYTEMTNHLTGDALGRITVSGIGYVDIKDQDTLDLAKSYLQILSKKILNAEKNSEKSKE